MLNLFPRLLSAYLAVDDSVMGGSSRSTVALALSGSPRFEGNLVTLGGGFCSTRWELPPRALAGVDHVLLEVKGDGHTYRLTARTATTGVSDGYYSALFSTRSDGESSALVVTIGAMEARWRGRLIPHAPTLRGEDIVSMGIMIDKGPHKHEGGGGGGGETAGGAGGSAGGVSEQRGPFALELVSLAPVA